MITNWLIRLDGSYPIPKDAIFKLRVQPRNRELRIPDGRMERHQITDFSCIGWTKIDDFGVSSGTIIGIFAIASSIHTKAIRIHTNNTSFVAWCFNKDPRHSRSGDYDANGVEALIAPLAHTPTCLSYRYSLVSAVYSDMLGGGCWRDVSE